MSTNGTGKQNLDGLKLIVFDMDGTLYNQKLLRLFMLLELFFHYLIRPHKSHEINILKHFRNEREKKSFMANENTQIAHNQYIWCQDKVKCPIWEIKDVVRKWIYKKPLKYLPLCMYKSVKPLLSVLKTKNIKSAIFSDYRAEEKVHSLGLSIDYVFSSEQEEIGTLKPSPKGLDYISNKLGIDKNHMLYIGDREDKDGACAYHAGVAYLDVGGGKTNLVFDKLISDLG